MKKACQGECYANITGMSMEARANEPWMICGFDLQGRKVFYVPKKPEDNFNACESLKKHMRGETVYDSYLAAAEEASKQSETDKALYIKTNKTPMLVWTEGGLPQPVNVPHIYAVTPAARLKGGDIIRIAGANIHYVCETASDGNSNIALVDEQEKIYLLPFGGAYGYERSIENNFIVNAVLPSHLAAGKYRLYVNNGYSDIGWSEPFELEIEEPHRHSGIYLNAVTEGVCNDGSQESGEALQHLIDRLVANGGGTIYLPSGRYILSKTLVVKPEVQLIGAGKESTCFCVDLERFGFHSEIDPNTYVYFDVKGVSGDWKPFKEGCAPMVWLQSYTHLEGIKIDADTIMTGDNTFPFCLQIDSPDSTEYLKCTSVYNCDFRSTKLSNRPEGKWNSISSGVLILGKVYGLDFRNNTVTAFYPFEMDNGPLKNSYIGFNTFCSSRSGNQNVSIRTPIRSTIEENRLIAGGRGMVIQRGFLPDEPTITRNNLFIGNSFTENMGVTNGSEAFMYETGNEGIFYSEFEKIDDRTIRISTEKQPLLEREGFYIGSAVYVTDGCGVGSLRFVEYNKADGTIGLDKPWLVDDSSKIIVMQQYAIDNIHIWNRFSDGTSCMMQYGTAFRNIYAANELSGDALVMDAVRYGLQVYNLIKNNRLRNGGRIALYATQSFDKSSEDGFMHDGFTRIFANEIRTNTNVFQNTQLAGINNCDGSQWTFTRGSEGGITLKSMWSWPPEKDATVVFKGIPAKISDTLVYDNFITGGDNGVFISKNVANTIIDRLYTKDCLNPIQDLGENTVNLNMHELRSRDLHTRGGYLAWLVAKYDLICAGISDERFADVRENTSDFEEIHTALKVGIVNIGDDGLFYPRAQVSESEKKEWEIKAEIAAEKLYPLDDR